MNAAPKDARRGCYLLELELLMVVNCNVGLGNQTQVLWKSNQGTYSLNQISSPMIVISVHFSVFISKVNNFYVMLPFLSTWSTAEDVRL